MDIIPEVKVERFEQLKDGDLFVYLDDEANCIAIKTAKPANGDKNEIALLGPTFPRGISDPHLVPWTGVTCVSFGQNYSVLLPTKASAWTGSQPASDVLCLARVENRLYVRVNGENFGRSFFPCYVELSTGAVTERMLTGIVAYAAEWEFVIRDAGMPPRSILKFPYL